MACYWAGGYSVCTKNGPIDRFVRSLFPEITILSSDGYGLEGFGNTPVHQYPSSKYVGALCSRVQKENLVLLPLDDITFEHGLFKGAILPEWRTRRPILFWRGGSSGYEIPSIRERVIAALIGSPHSDVKLTHWGGWEDGKGIPEHFFADRCGVERHFHYKYILIVDGNCIASNLQWVFGSGSVPVMVTHPDNDFWFKRYLLPMVNYVPIHYDLSNLNETLEWLVTHDEEAKQISVYAKQLADTIFEPQFQREHLESECKRLHDRNTTLQE